VIDFKIAKASLAIVLRHLGRIVTIFALCCAIGLQWIALQSLAWTTDAHRITRNARRYVRLLLKRSMALIPVRFAMSSTRGRLLNANLIFNRRLQRST